jgi:hypothetical protein
VPEEIPNEIGDDNEEEDDDPTTVIFTLSVISDHEIAGLESFFEPPRRPRDDETRIYTIHHFKVVDDDWSTRGDSVDAGLLEALDRLDATGIPPQELRGEDVWVRALFTFSPGAETITSDVIERLAKYHVTIWIDTLS